MNTNSGIIEMALEVATEAHRNQRDQGGKPYIFHCICVGMRMSWANDMVKAAAILHDSVEDSKGEVTFELLTERGFPKETVQLVKMLTHVKGETYDEYIDRLSKSCREAVLIKLADIAENTREDRRGFSQDEFDARLIRYGIAKQKLLLALENRSMEMITS